jgi:hypothetical protein
VGAPPRLEAVYEKYKFAYSRVGWISAALRHKNKIAHDHHHDDAAAAWPEGSNFFFLLLVVVSSPSRW